MAEVIVSIVADLLIDIIKDQILYEIHLVRGVDKEVLNLSSELKSLKNVLDDAENRRFQEKNINHWLSKLEGTSYEMEGILDEWNYALLKLKMSDVAPPKHEFNTQFLAYQSSVYAFYQEVPLQAPHSSGTSTIAICRNANWISSSELQT
ncbi:hypothetical protein ACS0TY_020744 [Phlomoides rotata]